MTEHAPTGGRHVDVDVVVVGGGPVGVMTGLLCAQRGLSVLVVERDVEVVNTARAIGMDDEVQRIFQGAGLEDRLRAITTRSLGAEFVQADGERVIGIEIPPDAPLTLGHWPQVMYHQPDLETMLRDAAVGAGVELRLGTEVVAVDDHGGRVVTTMRSRRDETESQVVSRWVVGADGASSGVRKSLAVTFDDLGFDQDWLVVDTRLRDGVDVEAVGLPRLVRQICDPRRPATFVPGHDRARRWEFQLQPGETRDEMTAPERVDALLRTFLDPADLVIERVVVYRFHATVASTMRVGSVFLAGDAAHQMPPFLGQGLCSGLRDAANLAWKMAMVADGIGGDRLLDAYDAERRPHATGLVAHAIDTGRLIDQLAGRSVPEEVGTDAGYGGGRSFPILEHGVLVAGHPMVGRQLPQPRVDGRLLDELLGDGWSILCVDASFIDEGSMSRWVQVGASVVALGSAWSSIPFAPSNGALIVRPDRYVAAACGDRDEFHDATNALFSFFG